MITPRLHVTNVSSFSFCPRKGWLEAMGKRPPRGSGEIHWGDIIHELHRTTVQKLRSGCSCLDLPEDIERFASDNLIDCITSSASSIVELAKAQTPLHADRIEQRLDRELAPRLLVSHEKRIKTLAALVRNGTPREQALNRVYPRDVEKGVGSTNFGVTGRVDQLWHHSDGLVPIDLKTGGPAHRRAVEPSHWIQVALYGILLEEMNDQKIPRVGLHYVDGNEFPEFRALDDELREAARLALSGLRASLLEEAPPPVLEGDPRCDHCPFQATCPALAPAQPPPRAVQPEPPTNDAAPQEEELFYEFFREVDRWLRKHPRSGRKEFHDFLRELRQKKSDLGQDHARKCRIRRLLKGLEEHAKELVVGDKPVNHAALFGGNRLEFGLYRGTFLVIGSEHVNIWVYEGPGASISTEEARAELRALAEREAGLPCMEVISVGAAGQIQRHALQESERIRTRSSTPRPPSTPTRTTAPASGDLPSGQGSRPVYVGFIAERPGAPLRFTSRGDSVGGYVKEETRDALMTGDLVVADQPTDQGERKRVFLRVHQVESAPNSVGTMTRSISELETKIILTPLSQRIGDRKPEPMANDDLNGYQIRPATADEIGDFLRLPSEGWPLGMLAHRGEPVLVNFPFHPADALYRSIFVVGAKGKGKSTFVRTFSTMITGFRRLPPEQRPAVIILDGEPFQGNDDDIDPDASEFHRRSLIDAHPAVAEQIGPDCIDRPILREIRFTPDESRLRFRWRDLRKDDLLLLLPSLTERGANVLRTILIDLDRQRRDDLDTLGDVMRAARDELQKNQQIDARIGGPVASQLHSPQAEFLTRVAKDACDVATLLVPGSITVLNVAALEGKQRKVLALYLLLALEQLAERREGLGENQHLNALLVLDEAEKLFPRKAAGQVSRAIHQRVACRAADIARRGRRRRFGLLISTQSPLDVDPDIVTNCDVKLTFCVTGQDAWIRTHLGQEALFQVKKLDTGCCFLDIRKLSGVEEPIKTHLFYGSPRHSTDASRDPQPRYGVTCWHH